MKAYKFRSVERLDYIFDILYNQRFHCADWHTLNDALEGIYIPGERTEDYEKIIKEKIRAEKLKYKVCSLSKTYKNSLLWAHYASGSKGFAIEVEIEPTETDSVTIKKICYRNELIERVDVSSLNPEDLAQKIVLSKYSGWKYENEIRILQEDEYFDLTNPIKKIIAGYRVEPHILKAFQSICKDKNISLYKMEFTETEMKALPVSAN